MDVADIIVILLVDLFYNALIGFAGTDPPSRSCPGA
jgi:hypothetical protein